ncbi:MAG: hypothetical protein GDA43_13060 [Hormoscilla sp. SP5CHS1]|nr:hypothetical protein [Hormoscilla sp. SP12CHS1]MBC6454009.1 hypothetical protein [Hormoscilla sp. SP5CHS1]MBC6475852.1 hypothetical protein [Hormoscilla sp. GM102CHS1]
MPERLIADLTIDELRAQIASVVDERMRYWRQPEPVIDKVALKKTLEPISSHRWTPQQERISVITLAPHY